MRGLGGKFCVKTPLKFGSTWKVITVFQAADFQSEFLFAEISVKCFYCCHWKHASVEAVCLGEDYSCRERVCVRQGQAFCQVYRYSPSQKSDTRQKYSQDNLVLLSFFFYWVITLIIQIFMAFLSLFNDGPHVWRLNSVYNSWYSKFSV